MERSETGWVTRVREGFRDDLEIAGREGQVRVVGGGRVAQPMQCDAQEAPECVQIVSMEDSNGLIRCSDSELLELYAMSALHVPHAA
jgi:hypothetical protein